RKVWETVYIFINNLISKKMENKLVKAEEIVNLTDLNNHELLNIEGGLRYYASNVGHERTTFEDSYLARLLGVGIK
ncbi:MAG: hypothetical protein QM536_09830, partial [Chitinophagaceae bacterium]|nr:hypothetical protein [Chitinophagaceae bacterium]